MYCGVALEETEWAFTLQSMISDDAAEGRRLTVPWHNVKLIQESRLSEAPWNQKPDEVKIDADTSEPDHLKKTYDPPPVGKVTAAGRAMT